MKAKRNGRYMIIDDGATWPHPFESEEDSVEWRLRYGNPTKEDLLYAASVMSAYAALVDLTAKRRSQIVHAMKETCDKSN